MTAIKSCRDARHLFAARREGLLDEPTRRRLGDHLLDCAPCRDAMRATRTLERRLEHEGTRLAEVCPPLAGDSHLALAVMDRVATAPPIARRPRRRIARWGSVAALVAAAAGVGLVILWPRPFDLDDVEVAMARVSCWNVRTGPEFEFASESWLWPETGVLLYRSDFSVAQYDPRRGNNLRHTPGDDYIVRSRDHKLDVISERIRSPTKVRRSVTVRGRTWSFARLERANDRVDGRDVVRFDAYFTDDDGREYLLARLWVDRRTKLLTRTAWRTPVDDDLERWTEWHTWEFEPLEDGPRTLEDLGVPPELRIIDWNVRETTPREEEILRASRAARERLPERYRIVARPVEERLLQMQIGWFDRHRWRHEHWSFLGRGIPAESAPGLDSVEMRRFTAHAVHHTDGFLVVCDGRQVHDARIAHHLVAQCTSGRTKIDARDITPLSRRLLLSFGGGASPREWHWSHADKKRLYLVERDTPRDDGLVEVYYEPPPKSGREVFLLDPDKDYACVRFTFERREGDRWKPTYELRYADFVQLAGGAWVARECVVDTCAPPRPPIKLPAEIELPDSVELPAEIDVPREHTWKLTLDELDADDFPADLFDGDSLQKLVDQRKKACGGCE